MKKSVKSLSICFLLLVSASVINGQIVSEFSLSKKNGFVLLDWVIQLGYLCDGINIERSTDSVNFIEIGNIYGVCGSLNAPVKYQFIDTSIENSGKYHYRLNMFTLGYSPSKSIVFAGKENPLFFVFPNPANERIVFKMKDQSFNEEIKFECFSVSGDIIFSDTLSLYDNKIMDVSKIKESFYYRVTTKNGIIQVGKILKN